MLLVNVNHYWYKNLMRPLRRCRLECLLEFGYSFKSVVLIKIFFGSDMFILIYLTEL
jgi:hypothetical protein